MLIPHKQLSSDALRNLIEEFVTRDGTDYGADEVSLAQKSHQVLEQLQRGEVVIMFDTESGGCNILPNHQVRDISPPTGNE